MKLILTHRHSHFDALAAQLAAYRLFEDAVPVLCLPLPAREQEFISQYQDELPFIRVEDLPDAPVSQLILINTLVLPASLRLNPATATLLIDHQPLGRPLAEHEQALIEPAGATSSVLVQQLIAANRTLSATEATLLLLGIYQATDRLSLPTTTPADASAVAWLLGHGAQLAAVQNYLLRPPALTAAEIMSAIPHVAPLEATIGETAELFGRYAHSALPVVDAEHQVRGLIFQRDVARASRHGLQEAPLVRYMWQKPLLIAPETPLSDVRQLLAGREEVASRLLVVDPQQRLLGIITRSDLLTVLSGASQVEPPVLATELTRFLDPAIHGLLMRAATLAEERSSALYVVGGTVRDLLLARPQTDLDLLVEGDAIGLAQALADELGGEVQSHAQFGTATLLEGDLSLDFVMARTEFYQHPSALPEVEPASLRYDLHRRDFTINTLAICLNPSRYGWLYDFYGGQRDIQRGLIRVLHNLSFIDDPTRVLRAARFAARLNFVIEPRTAALLNDALEQDLLRRTTPQRIMGELRLVLAEPVPERVLNLLQQLGVLAKLHAALAWRSDMEQQFVAARIAAFPNIQLSDLYLCLLWAPLSAQAREEIIAHYLPTTAHTRMLRDLSLAQQRIESLAIPQLPNSVIDRMLHGLSEVVLRSLQLTESPPVPGYVQRYLSSLRDRRPSLDGRFLKDLGLPPGPHYAELLAGLRAAYLDGVVQTPEEEADWLRAQVEREGRPEAQRL